jgi:hypothetical protein
LERRGEERRGEKELFYTCGAGGVRVCSFQSRDAEEAVLAAIVSS